MDKTLAVIEQATPELLTALLQTRDALTQGEVCDVQVGLFREDHRSLLAHLQLTYATHSVGVLPTQLLLKMHMPEDNTKRVQQAQYNKREIDFYQLRDVTDEEVLPFPRCYGAAYMPETGQHTLLLEDLSATHTPNLRRDISPPFAQCQRVVDSLAKIHAHWWGYDSIRTEFPDEQSIQAAVEADEECTARFRSYMGNRLSDERHALLQRALTALPAVLKDRLTTKRTLTLVHGCAHFWNVLYPTTEALENSASLIDWGHWHIDIGTCDLAYLLALHWYPERRARMEHTLVRHYYDRLLTYGVRDYSWEQCWYDYRLAVLRTLWVPLRQWADGVWSGIWWHHLERIFLACADLACVQLLEESTNDV